MDAEESVLQPSEVVGGRFRVIKVIGQGGFAQVYEALNLETSERVALKLLRPQSAKDKRTLARHVQEGMLLAEMDHPNIVRFEATGAQGRNIYIVMELLEGPTLRQLMRQKGQVPIGRAIRIARQLVGTFSYMAPDYLTKPEQMNRADPRWDIFAAAMVLYEAILGRHPLEGRVDTKAVGLYIAEMVAAKFPTLEAACGCPRGLSDVVATGLAKDPEERFQTILAFKKALDACLRDLLAETRQSDFQLPATYADLATGAWESPLSSSPPRAPSAAGSAGAPAVAVTPRSQPAVVDRGALVHAVTAPMGPVQGPGGTVRMKVEDAASPAELEAALARRAARLRDSAHTAPEPAMLRAAEPTAPSAHTPIDTEPEPPAVAFDPPPGLPWTSLHAWTAVNGRDVLIFALSIAVTIMVGVLMGWAG